MGGNGDADQDGDGDGDGHVNGYWGLGWHVDAGDCEGDGVEQEPELEHDVSRSTR